MDILDFTPVPKRLIFTRFQTWLIIFSVKTGTVLDLRACKVNGFITQNGTLVKRLKEGAGIITATNGQSFQLKNDAIVINDNDTTPGIDTLSTGTFMLDIILTDSNNVDHPIANFVVDVKETPADSTIRVDTVNAFEFDLKTLSYSMSISAAEFAQRAEAAKTAAEAAKNLTIAAKTEVLVAKDIAVAKAEEVNVLGYQGPWNASTNMPNLTNTPNPALENGAFYIVSVAGTQAITGSSIEFEQGDQIRKSGPGWNHIPNSIQIKNAKDISIYEQKDGDILQYDASSDDYKNKPLLATYISESQISNFPKFIGTSGQSVNDENWVTSDFIRVYEGQKIKYKLLGHTSVSSIACYNSANQFVSGGLVATSIDELLEGTFIVPSGVNHVTITGSSASYNLGLNYSFRVELTAMKTYSELNNLNDNISKKGYAILTRETSDLVVGYIEGTGNVNTTDANWRRSGFIQVLAGDEIEYLITGHTSVSTIACCDSNKQYISTGVIASENDETLKGVFIVPVNTFYVIISGSNPSDSTKYFSFSVKRKVEDVLNIKRTIDLCKTSDLFNGFIGIDGLISSSTDANWRRTDFIKSKAGNVYVLNMFGHPTAANSISFYDGNYNYILGFRPSSSDYINTTVVSPPETEYTKLCFASSVQTTFISSCLFSYSLVEKLESILDAQKVNPIKVLPRKVYSVANNINSVEKGFSRNYSAGVYLDHFFNNLTQEYDIKFKETGSDKLIFTSPINVTDASEDNPTVVYNVDNSAKKTLQKTFTITGQDISESEFSVSHVSTLETNGISQTPFILNLGDSITYAEMAKFPNETDIQSYSLLCKKLFEMGKIDNGDAGNNAIFLGINKRTLSITYKGISRTIVACHEGRRGWSTDTYTTDILASSNPFWDSTSSKFSIKKWIDNYRTLDQSGNRLASNSPQKGALVTDVNAFDVCVPTHINIMLGANNNETGAQYVAKLDALIASIQAEYTENGWGTVKIAVSLFDSAGTYFPSRHPSFDESIAIWNDTGNQGTRHNNMFTFTKAWLDAKANVNEDTAGVYHLPAYFCMPTAESAVIREVNLPTTTNFFGNEKQVQKYGWHPTVHLNPDAHFSFAYQLYSWIKYTL